MTNQKVPLCSSCLLLTRITSDRAEQVDEAYKCFLCFGILPDTTLRMAIVEQIKKKLVELDFDGINFMLAINAPTSMFLREVIMGQLFEETWNKREMNPKNMFAILLQKDIERNTSLNGSLNSDLILTVSLENDEFTQSDIAYLTTNFPQFVRRKRRNTSSSDNASESLYTRSKLQEVGNSISTDVAKKYPLQSPSRPCTFSVAFERDGIFIGGRYCKFSRTLPQSPWTTDFDMPIKEGNSVSEKIASVLQKYCKASSTRFISSGREDIDVRMLGNGRPFAVCLVNARRAACFSDSKLNETLKQIQSEINKNTDIFVDSLAKVTSQEAEKLNVGVEEKRKTYSALCYSKVPLTEQMLNNLEQCTPLSLSQRTVIRVLKRRPLHDRPRDIYKMRALQIDDYHFILKLETQAGTYIKEFIHGDFGRTTPSAGEVMGLQADQVDIISLDVEGVDLQWPPKVVHKQNGVNGIRNNC